MINANIKSHEWWSACDFRSLIVSLGKQLWTSMVHKANWLKATWVKVCHVRVVAIYPSAILVFSAIFTCMEYPFFPLRKRSALNVCSADGFYWTNRFLKKRGKKSIPKFSGRNIYRRFGLDATLFLARSPKWWRRLPERLAVFEFERPPDCGLLKLATC